ncbi:hypothetical protein COV04_02830 [Candidatus Uhrbacteria bacterium CG10_big_fil_rev_8_21_14_0_10_48_11]|uniref:Uncharacterized protein n=1 Tax=Candidatus Uhrbacteria bacterium CG10_big_fil_rev_8_21_14_0_10_48_11 TaxID=1975037 RepID=A0A2M8LEI1_9BACT|nr:MAG: hypothetical protein COV04_02830 [Candidatus Uhrbacteria bacterium CG10_big_fil_rev_8_21_14_0_10_48_11]
MTIQTVINSATHTIRRYASAQLSIVLLMAVLAFLLYAFFPWAASSSPLRFNSPDETANYFFSTTVAGGSGLHFFEPLSSSVGGVIHPRAMLSIGDYLVPASFIGLPLLYGGFALVVGKATLPYLTPFFTVLALLAAYGAWRRLFSAKSALLAAALLAIHPALWYYASRGFYHNVLFLDLIIFSVWGYCRLLKQKHSVEWLTFSLLLFMLALFVRSSEVLWLLPLGLAALWALRKEVTLAQLTIAVSSAGSLAALMALVFTVLYGLPLPIGYQAVHSAASATVHGGLLQSLFSIVLPFGFHPLSIVKNFFQYGVLLVLPFWLLVSFGLYGAWRERRTVTSEQRWYFYSALFVSTVVALYYGSWHIADTVGVQRLTLGNSYVRYWLPMYAVWLPYAGWGLYDFFRGYTRLKPVLASLMVVLGFISFAQVYFDKSEGLALVAARLATYRDVASAVNHITGDNAVIVGDRIDKLFFPERGVISPGDRPYSTYGEVMQALPIIADAVPLYVYRLEQLTDVERAAFSAERLIVHQPFSLPDGAWLYPVVHL